MIAFYHRFNIFHGFNVRQVYCTFLKGGGEKNERIIPQEANNLPQIESK